MLDQKSKSLVQFEHFITNLENQCLLLAAPITHIFIKQNIMTVPVPVIYFEKNKNATKNVSINGRKLLLYAHC